MSSNKFSEELDKTEKVDNAEMKGKKFDDKNIDTDKLMEFICQPVPKIYDKDVMGEKIYKKEAPKDKDFDGEKVLEKERTHENEKDLSKGKVLQKDLERKDGGPKYEPLNSEKSVEKNGGGKFIDNIHKNDASEGSRHGEPSERTRPPIEERWPGRDRKVERNDSRVEPNDANHGEKLKDAAPKIKGHAASAGSAGSGRVGQANTKDFLDFSTPLNVKGFDAVGAAGH